MFILELFAVLETILPPSSRRRALEELGKFKVMRAAVVK